MNTLCPACRSENTARWAEKFGYAIRRCRDCGHGFVHPMPEPEILAALYRERSYGDSEEALPVGEAVIRREKRFPNASLDANRMVRRARNRLDPLRAAGNPTFLDVGCGYGFASKAARKSGFAVTALEVSSSGRAVAAVVAGIDPLPVSFEAFETDQTYDVIYISQVIEHIARIDLWAEKAGSLLRGNGVLVLAMPNFRSCVACLFGKKDPYITPPMHLQYFTKKSTRRWLARHGFGDIHISGVSRLGPQTLYKRFRWLPESPLVIKTVRALQDAPFQLCGLLGFPIMLNVWARK